MMHSLFNVRTARPSLVTRDVLTPQRATRQLEDKDREGAVRHRPRNPGEALFAFVRTCSAFVPHGLGVLLLVSLSLLFASATSACSGEDMGQTSRSNGGTWGKDARCMDGVKKNGNVEQVCCEEGETITDVTQCTYSGFIASCARANDNCIQRTNDGEYAVNCWAENCDDCPSAPNYGVLVVWCANN